jgi:hypothetical protein
LVTNARVGNDPPHLDITEAGIPCSSFQKTLWVLLIVISFPNTGIIETMGLMALPFPKARTLLRDNVNILNWLLVVLGEILALQSSAVAFMIPFLKHFLHPNTGSENVKKDFYVNGRETKNLSLDSVFFVTKSTLQCSLIC